VIVVSDTSCITNLIAINRARLLEELFGSVIIPPAVQEELAFEHATLPDFVEVRAPRDRLAIRDLMTRELDAGEAEAIVLAVELRAEFLLIDELAGPAVAEARGLTILGLIGVLRRARDRGLISVVRPDLEALSEAGFWIAPQLRERVLRDVGEA
jgi:predicted nucleic acid-binding protein